ncbi:hypothetical protein BT96DRAFT_984237 [Gymnopus androsaceus JB14]|uniref:Helicase C-terminal domain-containing protein n=1 Tax=Gymnopus androsaceus JB14 TaxID=1447944 RepID=A0A6A4IM31_9AGAR|nr:hypothetical protein BT96DRAFT_984237 [Gymnopus androsaceus JB14]
MDDLKEGNIWGIICTDVAGMGLDVSNIELVVQWGHVDSTCTLVQRLGRGGRDTRREARGVYFVESEYFDAARRQKEERRAKKCRKKAKGQNSTPKRRRVVGGADPCRRGKNAETMVEKEDNGRASESGESDDSDIDAGKECDSAERHHTVNLDKNTLPSHILPSRKGMASSTYENVVMDAFVNAESQGYCPRQVLDEYYHNDCAMEFHCHCNGRCSKRISHVCCSVCNPESDTFAMQDLPSLPTKKRGKNRIKLEPYDMEDADYDFRDDLNKWRHRVLVESFQDDVFYGAELILPNGVRDRIVNLVHYGKLGSVQTLVEQTKWNDAQNYGAEIMAIIMKHHPPPPPLPSTPAPTSLFASTLLSTQAPATLTPLLTASGAGFAQTSQKAYSCGRCKAAGLPSAGHTGVYC